MIVVSINMNIISKLIIEFTSRYIRHEYDNEYCEYCLYKSYYCICKYDNIEE